VANEIENPMVEAAHNGAMEAISTLTKYAIVGSIGLAAFVLLVGEKRAKQLIRRVGV